MRLPPVVRSWSERQSSSAVSLGGAAAPPLRPTLTPPDATSTPSSAGPSALSVCMRMVEYATRARTREAVRVQGLLRQRGQRSHLLSTGVHTFGLCATALITNVLQLMTGNPTPYFLTVCKPNYSSLNTSCEQNPYVIEDICTGGDQAAISQGRSGLCSSAAFVRPQEPADTHARTHADTQERNRCTLPLAIRRKRGSSGWLEERSRSPCWCWSAVRRKWARGSLSLCSRGKLLLQQQLCVCVCE